MRQGQVMLKEAHDAIDKRGENYGDPLENFSRIASLWSVILETEVTPVKVGLCMDAVKTARLLEDPTHWDSWVDKAGYSAATVECFNWKGDE